MTNETAVAVELESIDSIKAKMREALDNGDDTQLERLASSLKSKKAEIVKAESAKFETARVSLANAIHKAVKNLPETKQLADVKAKGFTFKLDGAEEGITYKSVALLISGTKGSRSGVGGGAGKTKSELGITLDALYVQYKDAVGDIKCLNETGSAEALMAKADTNSRQWQVKTAVKKKAIELGLVTAKS